MSRELQICVGDDIFNDEVAQRPPQFHEREGRETNEKARNFQPGAPHQDRPPRAPPLPPRGPPPTPPHPDPPHPDHPPGAPQTGPPPLGRFFIYVFVVCFSWFFLRFSVFEFFFQFFQFFFLKKIFQNRQRDPVPRVHDGAMPVCRGGNRDGRTLERGGRLHVAAVLRKGTRRPSFCDAPSGSSWERRWSRMLSTVCALAFAASLVEPAQCDHV